MTETCKAINAMRKEIYSEKFMSPEQMLEVSRLEFGTIDQNKEMRTIDRKKEMKTIDRKKPRL